ncbi:HisA/HisF-related TIM barrel protein [Phytohabitans houttuyneae]|uniref:thiazole synthase n=1 Tax=Phytohabitans houttuyneae TaxID=1076126 RepID=A0A6V8K4W1_9ACTN|nr:HisA/HisF-related TIM barrel protein [Phytohabitans houttuyneae]GFJ77358.1 thiazole synthase [Phytohabitans houttuyneae]
MTDESSEEGTLTTWLDVAGHRLQSRLIIGIEQYDSAQVVGEVLTAAGADVLIMTVDTDNDRPSILLADLADALPLSNFVWIGTTSFARSVEAAVWTAHVLNSSLGIKIIKLDVRDQDNMPDNELTVAAADELLARGTMELLPFIRPDVLAAQELERAGCAAIRVMASPVGSGRGILDVDAVREIIRLVSVPVIVEGGIGSAAHVAQALELGAAAVLVNTALQQANDRVKLATAMRHAAIAGRLSFEAG